MRDERELEICYLKTAQINWFLFHTVDQKVKQSKFILTWCAHLVTHEKHYILPLQWLYIQEDYMSTYTSDKLIVIKVCATFWMSFIFPSHC